MVPAPRRCSTRAALTASSRVSPGMNADTDRLTNAVLVARSRRKRLLEAARSAFLVILTAISSNAHRLLKTRGGCSVILLPGGSHDFSQTGRHRPYFHGNRGRLGHSWLVAGCPYGSVRRPSREGSAAAVGRPPPPDRSDRLGLTAGNRH